MNSRWGRPIQPKGTIKTAGQNNINININFNAVKDKPNAVFAGKKLDNFIQIAHEPRATISRPNVSTETLKQKKKKSINREDNVLVVHELERKRSRSKIINQVATPEKIWKERHFDNSKSVGKKSTKKRSAKSYQNLKKYYGKSSPRDGSKQKQHFEISQAEDHDKSNSKSGSKEKQKSKSNKKLLKNSSKTKIGFSGSASGSNTRAKNSSHNSKKEGQQEKISVVIRNKKPSTKKIQKSMGEKVGSSQNLNKKPESEKVARKKMSDEDNKRSKLKTPKRRSKQKSSKSLKRLPLFYEQEEQNFDQKDSYKKVEKQAHELLYEEQKNQLQNKKGHKKEKEKRKQHILDRYMSNSQSLQQLRLLTKCAIVIQKHWRGYKTRSQFINELNMMNHRIQITRNKIQNLDPKFWDDAQSNSILKADDAASVKSSQAISELKSEPERPDMELRQNRIIELPEPHQQMLERIAKLEQHLRKEQAKAQQLQNQNKQLKINLQKIGNSSVVGSGMQSMEESLKSDQSWEIGFKKVEPKHEQDPFLEEKQRQKETSREIEKNFNIRMPTKVEIKEVKKQTRQIIVEQKIKTDSLKSRMQYFQCSSPKYNKMVINSDLLGLFQKKQQQLKQSFDKKVSIFDRMLRDSIFSPRTYTLKKNQLQQKFRTEAQAIKAKRQQVSRVAGYIKQIQSEQSLLEKEKEREKQEPKIQPLLPSPLMPVEKVHVIQDFGAMNLNSHRSKSESEECDQFQSSIESQKSQASGKGQYPIPKFETSREAPVNLGPIEGRNGQAIRIFQQISEHYKSDGCDSQHSASNNSECKPREDPEQLQNNSSQFVEGRKQPKGLETTLLFIKQYCVSFVEFIRSSEEHKSSFIQSICSPIVYNSLQLLRSYRTTTGHENDSSYNSQEKEYIYPYFKLIYPKSQSISREAFMEFNQAYDKLQGDCFYRAEREFFLNSLLDAFNESLDYKRPCSIYGEPPIWVAEYRRLKNHYLTKQDLAEKQSFLVSQKFDQICGLAIARVIQWSTSLCGFIPESPEMQNLVIEQQQINHIRETRIALMLEKDLLESEEGMLDAAIQQTEVKLQLGEVLLHDLINEMLGEGVLTGQAFTS